MTFSSTAKNRAVWGVRILLALAFGAAGAAKLVGAPMMVGTFDAIGWGQWLRYLTGAVEVLGVVVAENAVLIEEPKLILGISRRRWTILLLLAYVGSRFVLEVILRRAA